jgi:hypothetical protein
MAKFGGSPKVYASDDTKPLYNMFVDELKMFPSMSDLFHLCAAIGIRQDKRTEIKEKYEMLNVYSIDKEDIFETLLESMMPDVAPEQRLVALQEYAETGILYLKEVYDRDGRLDWDYILGLIPAECLR